ncbi:MAG: molybdopterin cofactor-binding domain-containing protein [Gemmataceae bacterium]
MPADGVRVIVPDTGSGYGGKHTGDAAVEAARLSKAAGRPVKLVWTREEEFTWAYFRPAGVIEVKGGGGRTAPCSPGRSTTTTPGRRWQRRTRWAHRVAEFHPADSLLRQGSYRLAATANHFARESHMDDLAWASCRPRSARLPAEEPARRSAAGRARGGGPTVWLGRSGARTGQRHGLAVGTEKGGYVAQLR